MPIQRRKDWVTKLDQLSASSTSFSDCSKKLLRDLSTEIKAGGTPVLLEHLHMCGVMPEEYAHDSSVEKLYSKYTDGVIHEAFKAIGLRSMVLVDRADSADVQAKTNKYSLVADAKAFRLSRTAKNQKDYKIQALDGWRNSCNHAVLVCPIYQMPSTTSQIYMQAITRDVCVLSYAHLAVLVDVARDKGTSVAEAAFHKVLQRVTTMNPSKSAVDYWTAINSQLLSSTATAPKYWAQEKKSSLDAVKSAKRECLAYLTAERNRLLGLTHQDAVNELVAASGVNSRIRTIENFSHGDLLDK